LLAHFCVHITRSDQGHDLLSGDTNSVRIRVMNNPAPGHERGDPEFPANSPTRLAYFPLIVPRVTCGRATTARLQVNQKWRSIVRVVSVHLSVSLWIGAHS